LDLLFIRHGESYANTDRVFSNTGWKHGLTERGFLQAEAAAGQVQPFFGVPSRIYSSGLRRAYETASVISAANSLEHRVLPELAEVSMGILEGRSDAAGWRLHNTVWDRWFQTGDLEARVPGGESLLDVIYRFKAVISRLEEEEGEGAKPMLVSHGGFILAGLLNLVYNVPDFIPRRGHLANCDMVHLRKSADILTFKGFKSVSVR
jgi:probable phosphoglycerate mutase